MEPSKEKRMWWRWWRMKLKRCKSCDPVVGRYKCTHTWWSTHPSLGCCSKRKHHSRPFFNVPIGQSDLSGSRIKAIPIESHNQFWAITLINKNRSIETMSRQSNGNIMRNYSSIPSRLIFFFTLQQNWSWRKNMHKKISWRFFFFYRSKQTNSVSIETLKNKNNNKKKLQTKNPKSK